MSCRFHDLRHTALTRMSELDVPEGTMLALAGHMSRAMLERYNHTRMAAKRKAVEALALPKVSPKPEGVPRVPKVFPKIARRSRLSVVPRKTVSH